MRRVRAPMTPMPDDTAADTSHATLMKSKGGLRRVINATRYSMQGFAAAWRDEHAFRQELIVVIPLVVAAAVIPGLTLTQRALLIGSALLVLIAELLNSAVEAVVDLVTVEHHELAKKAKDIGSAAVFLAFTNAGVLWALILAERFLR